MHCILTPDALSRNHRCTAKMVMALLAFFACTTTTIAQQQDAIEADTNNTASVAAQPSNSLPFRQARYQGNALLIHLPTNAARALVMPEPVILQGDPEQMPGVELAYEGFVVGFFATEDFTRRSVSFLGKNSGTEYQLQIRASENGIIDPLEIVL